MPRYLDKGESKTKAMQRVQESDALQALEYLENEQNALEDDSELVAIKRALGDLDELTGQQMQFLVAYTMGGTLSEACRITGTAYQSHYNWLQIQQYRTGWENARAYIADSMEKMAFKLATGRLMKPIVNQGKVVTYERIIDTKMLAMILRALKPERYTERLDMTTTSRTPMKIVDKDAWESI